MSLFCPYIRFPFHAKDDLEREVKHGRVKSNSHEFVSCVTLRRSSGNRSEGEIVRKGRTTQTLRTEVILMPSPTEISDWAVLLPQGKNVWVSP